MISLPISFHLLYLNIFPQIYVIFQTQQHMFRYLSLQYPDDGTLHEFIPIQSENREKFTPFVILLHG